jgi:hypothetical protein
MRGWPCRSGLGGVARLSRAERKNFQVRRVGRLNRKGWESRVLDDSNGTPSADVISCCSRHDTGVADLQTALQPHGSRWGGDVNQSEVKSHLSKSLAMISAFRIWLSPLSAYRGYVAAGLTSEMS